MVIRIAETSELEVLMPIYDYARRFMIESGNRNQWVDNYPSESRIRADIENGNLFVIEESGIIHGAFVFIIGRDPTYDHITDGTWLSEDEYGTIHRVASDGKSSGIFAKVVDFCGQRINHLRIDTHKDNKIMRHLIEKSGFQRRGIIFTDNGSARIAYERIKK